MYLRIPLLKIAISNNKKKYNQKKKMYNKNQTSNRQIPLTHTCAYNIVIDLFNNINYFFFEVR